MISPCNAPCCFHMQPPVNVHMTELLPGHAPIFFVLPNALVFHGDAQLSIIANIRLEEKNKNNRDGSDGDELSKVPMRWKVLLGRRVDGRGTRRGTWRGSQVTAPS
ncbi:hypothetical protein JI435_410380 [Parastagonospora nodorum SN15]|uniref:Uncharacterized protein n=1 Tax=Phaeosphaeria nodorum (strain SN15 / ATCC MYA-4574 / FGSC 10173) TaxID=321614 RepID=A0A7U2HZ49_PHANO|nr:hypothetical protein JI435_410380 [Parastagonospora nodorum SN15]